MTDLTEQLKKLVETTLDDAKANDVQTISLAGKADYADYIIVASGTSDRHLRAMADRVLKACKENNFPPVGTEGEDSRDWVLVDLGDIIVHLMRPETRELYALEKLWSLPPTRNH